MAFPRKAVNSATIVAAMSCAVITSMAFAGDSPVVTAHVVTEPEPLWKMITEIAAVVISAVTIGLAIWAFRIGRGDYRNSRKEAEKANSLNRFKSYQEMQRRFISDKSHIAVFKYLYPEQYTGESTVAITMADKRNFMIFLQEIEVMIRSELMIAELAYFAFGNDAVNFWDREAKEYEDRLAV